MLNRWKIIDILLVIQIGITCLSFFILPPGIFKLFFWSLLIFIGIRLLLVTRKKLFWKIRNRLIFSGLFLVATPIFFISLFFTFIVNVLIAQYGTVIIENLLNRHLENYVTTASSYLGQNEPKLLVLTAQKYIIRGSPYMKAAFWEKRPGTDSYQLFFRHPQSFNASKIEPIKEFSGYFLVDNKLHHGALLENDHLAILVSMEVTQEYMDMVVQDISDFKLKFRNPKSKVDVHSPIKNTPLPDKLDPEAPSRLAEDEFVIFPFVFEYNYIDFDADTFEKTDFMTRRGDFILSSDSDKVFQKIQYALSGSAQGSYKKIIFALIIFFGTFIVISFLIGFRMVGVLTRSIDQLTRGTQRIRNGDFSFRIKTRSRDQMQYLAECFNEMAAGIARLLIDEKEKHRLEEELRIARSIQLKLLPPESFSTDEFELAAVNIPAEEIAGDYFDYFYKKDSHLSLLVADVSGKGSSAAFYMAELKGAMNHLQREGRSPAELISECHFSLKDTFDKITFITINIAQFRIPEKKFVLARGGHTPAVYFNARENTCTELHPAGMAIGLIAFSKEKLDEVEVSYGKGDILLLFSDGLTEIMNEEEEMLGIHEIKRIVHRHNNLSVEELKAKILDFSIEFSESSVKRDDLTFIILKIK
jgi:serine phosphatase RsbU (regulator of sigma subunit)